MGVATVTAARILKGQLAGKSGEESNLVMDTFPHVALSKVFTLSKTFTLKGSIHAFIGLSEASLIYKVQNGLQLPQHLSEVTNSYFIAH